MIDLVMITPGTGGEGDKKHPPLGLLYIGSALQKVGFEVKIHHILPQEIENRVIEIAKQSPLFVGFSVLTGLTTFYAAKMSARIKTENRNIPIVWGGHHPTFMAEQCLGEDFVDVVCMGEGEDTSVELARALDSGKSLCDILSVGFKDNGQIVINKMRPRIENIDRLELDWSLLNLEDYAIEGGGFRIIGFCSSRGCPFNCGFCSSVRFCERTWRPHSIEYVVSYLTHLKDRYGFNAVFFADDNFMVRKQRGYEIIERLKERGVNVNTLDIRVDMLEAKMLDRLSEYGTTGIFFGWESGSDRLLELMDKGITVAEILVKAKLLSRYPRISVWGSGIIGLPTETREEMQQTIATAMELFEILPNATTGLFQYMPLPGTALLPLAVEGGFKVPARTEDWRVVDPQWDGYNISWLSWLTEKEAAHIKIIQHISRRYLHKTRTRNRVVRKLNNLFVSLLRLRIQRQNFKFLIDLYLYRILRSSWQGLRRLKKRRVSQ